MTKDENAGESKTAKKNHGNKEKLKPPTKIVIRHLPPTMTEEEFLKQIDPLPAHDFYYYAAADWSLGFDATCRAYLTVKNYDDVFLFRDRFDGYVFVDAKGAEYPAIVEFAPFQGLVKNKSRRSDNKVNSIEEEAHYQQFLIKLEEERDAVSKGAECKLEFNLNIKKEEITSTPLLQYLANKKEKRRQESKKRTEDKKRQREDEREKRRQVAQSKQTQPTIHIIGANKTDDQTEATKRESGSQSKESNNKNVSGSTEDKDKLNARAKRRNERNQRRHDDYLLRKQNEKAAKDIEASKVEQRVNEKKTESSEQNVADKEKKSRRERDREREKERNRARRERERQKMKKENDERKNSLNERKMSGNLQDVPKMQSKEKYVNNKHNENDIKMKTQENDEEQQRKLRAAEERRIRNKDRPSIAIYQPKARLRLSEESDGNGVDSEASRERSVEKSKTAEIPITKKVSRYSERRNERRAAAKEKENTSSKTAHNDDMTEAEQPEINAVKIEN